MDEFQGKNCWPKITQKLISLPENILIIPNTFGKVCCELMRQKYQERNVCTVWVTSKDNVLKHRIKSKMWRNLNQAFNAQKLAEVKQFYKQEWAKNPS